MFVKENPDRKKKKKKYDEIYTASNTDTLLSQPEAYSEHISKIEDFAKKVFLKIPAFSNMPHLRCLTAF